MTCISRFHSNRNPGVLMIKCYLNVKFIAIIISLKNFFPVTKGLGLFNDPQSDKHSLYGET